MILSEKEIERLITAFVGVLLQYPMDEPPEPEEWPIARIFNMDKAAHAIVERMREIEEEAFTKADAKIQALLKEAEKEIAWEGPWDSDEDGENLELYLGEGHYYVVVTKEGEDVRA